MPASTLHQEVFVTIARFPIQSNFTLANVERSALIGFSAEQLYQLVNDIESYPQYMPGCSGAQIIKRDGDTGLVAKLELSQSGFSQSFTTRNRMEPGKHIIIELEDGPFKQFHGQWEFETIDESSCKVTFKLDFQFSNFLLNATAGKLIQNIAAQQVDAVCQRAKEVYG